MPFNTPWPQVYRHLSKLPPTAKKRLTIELPLDDAHALLSCSCNSAIFSLVCQTALKLSADFVRENNLTYADAERLVEFVCKRTVDSTTEKATAPNVSSGATGVHAGVKDVAEKSAGPGKEVETGVKGGGGGGRRGRGGDGGGGSGAEGGKGKGKSG